MAELDKPRDLRLTYHEAAHAMQSGVAFEMNNHSSATDPKHLRVGVNSVMVDSGALAMLLIDKGIITREEYIEAVRLMMNEEVARYEDRALALGTPAVKFR